MAISDPDDSIRFWDVIRWQQQPLLLHPPRTRPGRFGTERIFFSPDGRGVAAQGAGSDALAVWDLPGGNLIARIPRTDRSGRRQVFFFGPDKSTLLSSTLLDVVGEDPVHSGITIWNLNTQAKTLIRNQVLDFTVSGDGKTMTAAVATAAGDTEIQTWNVATHRRLPTYHLSNITRGSLVIPGDLALNQRGDVLAIAGTRSRLEIVETAHGQHVKTLDTPPFAEATTALPAVQFAGNDMTLVSTRNSLAVTPAEIQYDQHRIPIQEATGAILTDPVFAPDRRLAAIDLTCHTSAVPGGNSTACTGSLTFWNTSTHRQLPTEHPTQTDDISGPLAFSQNGSQLAVGSSDGQILLWQVDHTPRPIKRIPPPDSLPSQPGSHSQPPTVLAFESNGTLLTVTDGIVRRWDGTHWWPIGPPMPGSERTPQGAQLVQLPTPISVRDTQILDVPAATPTIPEIWTAANGRTKRLAGIHHDAVIDFTATTAGNRIATIDAAGTIQNWDLNTGTRHGDPITEQPARQANIRLTTSGDRLVYINLGPDPSDPFQSSHITVWNVQTKQPILNAERPNDYQLLSPPELSPDGSLLALPNRYLNLIPVQADTVAWQQHLCNIAGRDLTHDEWHIAGLDQWQLPACT